ncbi:MAG: tetratricopeptide repeat protein, partial [Anaerolineales bacterium]|nr:tetratricopeptide repeat protein [Anaerolineales bacterium]
VTHRRGRALLLSTLGSLLAEQRRYQEAETHFRQALDLHEKDPLTHYHFAVQVLLPTGRREEACAHLRRALELNPRKPRDRARIEQALQKNAC